MSFLQTSAYAKAATDLAVFDGQLRVLRASADNIHKTLSALSNRKFFLKLRIASLVVSVRDNVRNVFRVPSRGMTFDLSATEKSAEVRCVYVRLRDDDGPCTVPVCIDDNGTFAVRNSYGRKSRGKSSLPIKGRARFTSRFTGKTSCFATGDDRTGSNSSANRFDSARERSSGCYRAAHTTEPVRESARRPPRRPGGDVSLRRPPR